MKYTSLKNDIVNILHSSDYNLYLKFYDEEGNTTLDIDSAKWCYINNYNIMIEFMEDDNPNLSFWKDNNTTDSNLKDIIQRIRELAILNGVSVQIRVYDDLNQRKIYNLIKNTLIQTKQEENMNESVNNSKLVECFYNIINMAKNTKKSSDFYLSEEMKTENIHKILSEVVSELKSYNKFKKLNLNEMLSKLIIASSIDDIKLLIAETHKNKKIYNTLLENIDAIKNITSFVKNSYLNQASFSKEKATTLYILENAKVYSVKEHTNKDNLINAYNILVANIQDAKTGTDIIRQIKNNKLCETFNITRKELIDFWLSENSNKPIKPKKALIIEDSFGNKNVFNENMAYGIKTLAKFINNGGKRDSEICKNIMLETIKYNEISSFIKEYQNDYRLRKYIPKMSSIFKENIEKLTSDNFNEQLFESFETNIDFSQEYNKLVEEMNIDHPAIKYLAISEAQKNAISNSILFEQNIEDMKNLQNALFPFVKKINLLEKIIESVMNHKIKIKTSLLETVNTQTIYDTASKIYKELCFENNDYTLPISSVLFDIIHSKKILSETSIKFVNTLLKYIR